MLELKHKDRIEVEIRSVFKDFMFLNTRLIIPLKYIRDQQEIDSIVSDLQKLNFIILFGKCIKEDFILVIENSDSIMEIARNLDYEAAYEIISEYLLECMDKIVTCPYKLILEVY